MKQAADGREAAACARVRGRHTVGVHFTGMESAAPPGGTVLMETHTHGVTANTHKDTHYLSHMNDTCLPDRTQTERLISG